MLSTWLSMLGSISAYPKRSFTRCWAFWHRNSRKDRKSWPEQQYFLSELAELVVPRKKLAVLDDEPDNRILECAGTGHADVIVTGDRAMLNLKKYREIRIASLRQFLDEISILGS